MTHVVDIIVPVLNRPGHARPFVDSLQRSVEIDRVAVLAVGSPWDRPTLDAWRDTGADVITCPGTPGSYPRKVNHAYRALEDPGLLDSPAPWMLLVGDDVKFHLGWLDHALAVARTTGAAVISTDDRGFEVGANSCVHPLIDRDYVRTYGASWDGPGVVCHEGYGHNYVDAEIWTLARWRNAWAPAPDAVIEHLHHQFRRAAVDATYELGTSTLAEDRALFEERYHRWVEARGPQPVA